MADSLYYLVLVPDDVLPVVESFATLDELKKRLMEILPQTEACPGTQLCAFYGRRLDIQYATSSTTCVLESPKSEEPVELTFGSVSGLQNHSFVVPDAAPEKPFEAPISDD